MGVCGVLSCDLQCGVEGLFPVNGCCRQLLRSVGVMAAVCGQTIGWAAGLCVLSCMVYIHVYMPHGWRCSY